MARTFVLKLAFLLSGLLAAPAFAGDGSAHYGPLDSQSGSLVDSTPGTKRADQRSPCERLKGKAKQSCLKKKPGELAASPGKAPRSDAARGAALGSRGGS